LFRGNLSLKKYSPCVATLASVLFAADVAAIVAAVAAAAAAVAAAATVAATVAATEAAAELVTCAEPVDVTKLLRAGTPGWLLVGVFVVVVVVQVFRAEVAGFPLLK